MIAATCPRHGTRLESVGYRILACPEENCSYGTTLTAIEDASDKEKREAATIQQQELTIDIPIPPSVNSMFPDGSAKRGLSAEYRQWRDDAGWRLKTQNIPQFTGQVLLDMTIIGGKGFPTSSDLSNRWKAVEDLLVRHGIIQNDNVKFVVGHCDRYVTPTDKDAIARCILTITQAPSGEETEARLAKVGTKRIAELRKEHGL